MELKPQFWITAKLRYRNDSSVTSQPVFLQRYNPFFFSISFSCRDKTFVVTLKNGSTKLTQVPDLHSLQSQPCRTLLVRWLSPLYFNPQTVTPGWGIQWPIQSCSVCKCPNVRIRVLTLVQWSFYRGADKSLARPGKKLANVSVRMAWISFGSLSCRGKKTWWKLASRCCWNRARPWHASELISFVVGLRNYQHPGIFFTSELLLCSHSIPQRNKTKPPSMWKQ